MDTVKVRTVSPSERRKLHRLKRQLTNHVNCSHARIILLSSGRVGNREIGVRVGYTQHWVRQIIHRFNHGGIGAVEWYPYWQVRNVPRKFFADVVEQIAEVALSSAQALIGMTQWSLRKLREYLVRCDQEWVRFTFVEPDFVLFPPLAPKTCIHIHPLYYSVFLMEERTLDRSGYKNMMEL